MATTPFLQVKNLATGTLNTTITSGGLSIILTAGQGTKFPTTGNTFIIWIESEAILIDSRSTDTFTVNASGRGYNGTVAAAHTAGVAVTLEVDAKHIQDLDTATNNLETLTQTGWVPFPGALTYSSVDDPTGIVSVASDATTYISVGMRLKFTNGGFTIYGIVTAVAATTITFLHEISPTSASTSGGTAALHLKANSAITNPYFSFEKSPFGFPPDARKWTVEFSNASDQTQSSPFNSTWYNLGTSKLDVPIGSWIVLFQVVLTVLKSSATAVDAEAALSTANNTASDVTMIGFQELDGASGNLRISQTHMKSRLISVASKTTHYLNGMSDLTATTLQFSGSVSNTIIRATCAHL